MRVLLLSGCILVCWLVGTAVWSAAYNPYSQALQGVDSQFGGKVQLAQTALQGVVTFPRKDSVGRLIPPGKKLILALSGCSKCSLKYVDLEKLRSGKHTPLCVFVTDPISTLKGKLPQEGIYVISDPFMKRLPQTLYIAAPRAAVVWNDRIREVDRGEFDLNAWIESRLN